MKKALLLASSFIMAASLLMPVSAGASNSDKQVFITNSASDSVPVHTVGKTEVVGNVSLAGPVDIGNLPAVELAGQPSVSIANTPQVHLAGTPSVDIAGMPNVTLAGVPDVNVKDPVSIAGEVGTVPARPAGLGRPSSRRFKPEGLTVFDTFYANTDLVMYGMTLTNAGPTPANGWLSAQPQENGSCDGNQASTHIINWAVPAHDMANISWAVPQLLGGFNTAWCLEGAILQGDPSRLAFDYQGVMR